MKRRSSLMLLWLGLPGIVRIAVVLAIAALLALAARAARAQDPPPAQTTGIAASWCVDGKLTAIQMIVTRPGVLTLTIPPAVCKPRSAPAPKPAASKPARST